MTEGVVDFLELVEVDDGDGRRISQLGPPLQLGRGPTVEQGPVGEVRQEVVLGQVHVHPHLASQPSDHPERDPEQHQVQQAQTDHQVAVEVVDPDIHVGGDRRVRQVHLEYADPGVVRPRGERQVHLDRLRPHLAGVDAVGVDVGESGDGGPPGGVERLVLGLVVESGTVVGKDDGALEVPDPEPLHVTTRHRAGGELVQTRRLVGAQAVREGSAVQDGLHGGLRHQDRFGPALGQAAPHRLGPIAPGQDDAEDEHRDQRDRGEDDELPHRRFAARLGTWAHEQPSAGSPGQLEPAGPAERLPPWW